MNRQRGHFCFTRFNQIDYRSVLSWLFFLGFLGPLTVSAEDNNQAADNLRPNFLIILADDMGWSDIGAFGGEIRTPNLDSLATQGVAMSNFYASPSCAPSRAMLMTGMNNHRAGVGVIKGMEAPNQTESLNYKAQLHEGVVTLAEVMRAAGYATSMVGKWHLGHEQEQHAYNRGFDQSYMLAQGGASHFGDGVPLFPGYGLDYLENGSAVTPPEDFYSSIFFADKAIEYIRSVESQTPFLTYLAFTAPHDPLQVPDAWLGRYQGVYDQGPDVVRSERIARQKQLGLIPDAVELWPPLNLPAWLPGMKGDWLDRDVEQRRVDAKNMELHAAMIEIMDQQIGRVLTALQSMGRLSNTYVIFMSDNGANPFTPLMYTQGEREWLLHDRDNRADNLGKPGSHIMLGLDWAHVANAPFKMFKGAVTEGGVRAPLIVAGPGISSGQRSQQLGELADILPTVLDAARVAIDDNPIYRDKLKPQGESLLQNWQTGKESSADKQVIMEYMGSAMIRTDRWKAHRLGAPIGKGEWELFDIQKDPAEMNNLASEYPQVVEQIRQDYKNFERQNGVIPPCRPLSVSLSVLNAGECNTWCEAIYAIVDWLGRLRNPQESSC